MKALKKLNQLKKGTKLKIIAECKKDCYGSVSVKEILKMEGPDGKKWTEILINKSKNYYFHFEYYLAGKSQWVKEVYVLDGIDQRLKQ